MRYSVTRIQFYAFEVRPFLNIVHPNCDTFIRSRATGWA